MPPKTDSSTPAQPSVEQAAARRRWNASVSPRAGPGPERPGPARVAAPGRRGTQPRTQPRRGARFLLIRERKRLKLQTRRELPPGAPQGERAVIGGGAGARPQGGGPERRARRRARPPCARRCSPITGNRALLAWIHQLNAPPAQMALKQPMMGMGVALDPQVTRRAVLVLPRCGRPVRGRRRSRRRRRRWGSASQVAATNSSRRGVRADIEWSPLPRRNPVAGIPAGPDATAGPRDPSSSLAARTGRFGCGARRPHARPTWEWKRKKSSMARARRTPSARDQMFCAFFRGRERGRPRPGPRRSTRLIDAAGGKLKDCYCGASGKAGVNLKRAS